MHFRESISIERKIAITLSRLAIGNSLQMTGDLFGVGLSTSSIIVRECCKVIRIPLKALVFKKPIIIWMKQIVKGFETLYSILFILRAINDSHIPIQAPSHVPVAIIVIRDFIYVYYKGS